MAPSGHFFILPEDVYFDALSLEIFARLDAAGSLSTIQSGALPRVGMGPIETADSVMFPNPVNANGQTVTGGTNDKGSLLAVAPMLCRVGMLAPPSIFSEVKARPVGVDVTTRFRIGFTTRAKATGERHFSNAVVLLRDIG